MAICEPTSFTMPMLADVYYPIVEQGALGNVKKQWVLDRSIACSLTPAGSKSGEEIAPNANITQEKLLIGRVGSDPRVSSKDAKNAITNIIITNIRDKYGNHIYTETSGPRAGKSTIFEIATNEPFVNPFGNVEYYKLILRRSENQGAEV